MNAPTKAPTAAMLVLCDGLDRQIEVFLRARSLASSIGLYEASVEASCLFNLCIRNIEAVSELARKDVVLLPAAVAAARAALEAATKAAWLVNTPDPMSSEARWLAHLQSEERYLLRAAKRLAQSGVDSSDKRERATQIADFRESVDRLLPADVERVKEIPKFDQMLESIGGAALYAHYIETSQYIHAEHAATWLYRAGGLGTSKVIAESVQPRHWWLPFRVAWLCLGRPAELVLIRLGVRKEEFAGLGSPQDLGPLISEPERFH